MNPAAFSCAFANSCSYWAFSVSAAWRAWVASSIALRMPSSRSFSAAKSGFHATLLKSSTRAIKVTIVQMIRPLSGFKRVSIFRLLSELVSQQAVSQGYETLAHQLTAYLLTNIILLLL